MANTLSMKKSQIYNAAMEAAKAAYPEIEIPAFTIEVPKDKGNGDYAINLAMMLARAAKSAPRAIAENIVANLKADELGATKIEIAGPGFINFYLDKSYLYNVMAEIEEEKEAYGNVNVADGKKVVVEFVSANPTGPMHMGNARGGALGDTLSNVLSRAGWDVTKEFYINDAGAQIDKFGRSLDARYIQLLKGEEAVEFPEDGYQGDDIRVHAQNYIDKYGDILLDKEEQERKDQLVAYALPLNIAALQETLTKYGINYDVWFYESTLHNGGSVEETLEKLKKSNITYEKDGALWIKSTEFGSEKDDVLVRANGIPTYFAADIAYHRNKLEERDFDLAINIWGADHHGHITRMKGAMEAVGISGDKLDVLVIQLVRLMRNGEVARMSKRTGKMITLADLIDEIGVDAARFFFNMRAAGSHMDFDLDLAVSQTNENPVFYVQYAHARICSIIRILEESGVKVPAVSDIDASLLAKDEEIELLETLARLPEEIKASAESFDPSNLTHYLIDVASHFHSFYNACRVRDEEENLMCARLKLIESTRIVIKNVLDILGVSAPEKM
ncbi:MAG: arginine--tRNA ligase [Clostridia bacterium]|nr:arginine--tRNA ligase [Clostridia bacterium]